MGVFEPRKQGEHVVAKGLGGSFTIPNVCLTCDNRLGDVADGPLMDHFAMLVKRASLGLKGQNRVVPDVMRAILADVGTAADDPTFRVDIDASSRDRRLDVSVRPHVDLDVTVNGDDVQVQVNALRAGSRHPERVEALFKSALRKKGVTDQLKLDTLWASLEDHVRDVSERRLIDIPFEYRADVHMAGFVKIAYELAYHWLGANWLSDPIAAEMRRCALAGEDGSPKLTGSLRTADEIRKSPLRVRNGGQTHVAALCPFSGGYAVMMRLLDEFEAFIIVADDASPYRHPAQDAVVMDAVARTHRHTSLGDLIRPIDTKD